jgi:predicted O-linked N-acetylglucosamine transferase (SPINDLY family)
MSFVRQQQPTARHIPPALSPDVSSLFNQALAFHQAGRLMEAEPLYRNVLQALPRHFDSLNLLGVLQYQLGRHSDAVREIDAALKVNPNAAAAHNNRGAVLSELKRFEEAAASHSKAIALKPDYADAFYNRGNVLKELRRYEKALEDYDRAIALRPNYPDAFNNRGGALKALKRFKEAVESYDQAIALRPDYADAWHNRAGALNELKRFEEALASCDRAIALKPNLAGAFNNRGNALKDLKRFEDALASYDQAIVLKPDDADALSNRGIAQAELKRFDEALADYERAIALRPDHADAFFNRGVVLAELGRLDDALASYEQATTLKADHAEAFYSRGTTLILLRRFEEALASLNKAVALKPDLSYLRGLHLHAKMNLCDWTHFDEECAGLHEAVTRGITACYPFQLLACSSSPQNELQCARIYVADKYAVVPTPLWQGERYSHERIRVAYTSSDLRDHPVTYLTAGMFERHDRTRFETIAISFGIETRSPMRERLKAAFDRFVDVRAMSDQDVAKLLRTLEVDIIVDLNGITDGSRPYIFAQRPAPVQVNYLGYAGTLGRNYWDYIIADQYVVPEEARGHFAEQVVCLPDSFMVTDGARKISARTPTRQEVGLPERGMVFCCFNNSFKITPDVFDVWMRLLREIDGSVLWLSAANSSAPNNLRREAERRGVSAERLMFAPKIPSNEGHLARIRLADLFLDTLYYNAHATASDALWAGVPVLTCSGSTFASRVAGSLLKAIGLPELITSSLADYEALAFKLARDPALLSSLRQKLTRQRETCPLFNTERFTRHIEAAYTTMWERSQRGEPPQSFAVAAIDQSEHA